MGLGRSRMGAMAAEYYKLPIVQAILVAFSCVQASASHIAGCPLRDVAPALIAYIITRKRRLAFLFTLQSLLLII